MTWDWSIKFTDVAIIIATGLGPILAVQIQKWLEVRRALTERRLSIFRTLMATRATRLSPPHVEALNGVPVEFYGKNRNLKRIQDYWQYYLDTLSNETLSPENLYEKRNTAFIDMMHSMAEYLGYDFSKSDIEKKVYHPNGLVQVEREQEAIRQGVAKLLNGEAAIPMVLKELHMDQDAVAGQRLLHSLLAEWLSGQRAVKVEQDHP